jgi:hypothetical protein
MAPTLAVSDLVHQVKGASSHLATRQIRPGEFFICQGGYGAFSVSKSEVQRVVEYIDRQEQHHKEGTTRPELEWDEKAASD